MPILETIRQTIKKYSMLAGGDKVLIGLSGGADSVCLLKTLDKLREEYNLDLHAVYVDHGLRPEETPAEAEFAKKTAENCGAGFYAEKIDVLSYCKKEGLGKQEAARTLRYEVYERLAAQIGANRIALGHTADDQVETFFMRLLRGAGRKGLSGIPPVRKIKGKTIIRPLIGTSRAAIEEFLRQEGAGFITDPTNFRRDYTRNKIRLDLLPVLKKLNPNLDETILRTAQILAEEERYFEIQVMKGLMMLLRNKTGEEIELFLVPLESMDTVLLRRTLRKAIELAKGFNKKRTLGFEHIEDMIGLIKKGKPGDRLDLPGPVRAVKKYSTFLISSKPAAHIGTGELDCPGSISIAGTGLAITASVLESAERGANGKSVAVLDAGRTGQKLVVRGRKEGDFFYPSGLGGKKKLQDFFVDEKVPRDERDAVPVVLSGDNIVWVAGMRADERFIAREDTKKFLVLTLHGK